MTSLEALLISVIIAAVIIGCILWALHKFTTDTREIEVHDQWAGWTNDQQARWFRTGKINGKYPGDK